MKRPFITVLVSLIATALIAGVLEAFGPNQTVSLRSPSYAPWAPQHLPRSGGIIFGKGQARFVVGNDLAIADVDTGSLEFNLTADGILSVLLDQQPYAVPAHGFSVCPMARHVQRNAPIAFTLPPYDDPSYFSQHGFVSYEGGYLAKDFLVDDRTAELVMEADFWPAELGREEMEMDETIREAILQDANNVAVQTPGEPPYLDNYTYFSGDFHVDAVILLDTDSRTVRVFGVPIVYYPSDDRDGAVQIFDVEFLYASDRRLAEAGQSFGPADFASLFDLSLIFAELRDGSPESLAELIDSHC